MKLFVKKQPKTIEETAKEKKESIPDRAMDSTT